MAISAVLATAAARADQPPGPRADLPVKLTVSEEEGGRFVYSAPMTLAGAQVDAVLATNTPITLILRNALKGDAKTVGAAFDVRFTSGETYHAEMADGQATLGAVSVPARFGVVTAAACQPRTPSCPIVDEPLPDVRFGYNTSLALLGLAPAIQRGLIPTPMFLGAISYTLTAPRIGEEGAGHLVLNPTADETKDFVTLTKIVSAAAHPNSLRGCLRNTSTKVFFCGAVVFDSAQTGIVVYQAQNRPENRDWAAGDAARLEFTDDAEKTIVSADFTVGRSTPLFVRFGPPLNGAEPLIDVGQMPYEAFQVNANFETGQIRVAPRPPGKDGVGGHAP